MIAAERATLQKTFAVEFPDYAALSNPLPMTAREIQSLLSGDEALVLFAVAEKESYVLAMTREQFRLEVAAARRGALSQKVAAFRRGLDVGKAGDASGKSGLFDLALANELYATLLGPVEALGQRQAQPAGGALRRADGAAVPSAGDGEAAPPRSRTPSTAIATPPG